MTSGNLDAALTRAQLGINCRQQGKLDEAERHLRQALPVFEQHGDMESVAMAYHQFGLIAQDRRDLPAAEDWYNRSVSVRLQHRGDQRNLAMTYHQLARVAQLLAQHDAAERWCQKALAIKERMRDDESAAPTYQLLGVIAEARGDLAAAERWCQKALAINQRIGNAHGAAFVYNLLGAIAGRRRQYVQAAEWFLKSSQSLFSANDPANSEAALLNMARCYQEAPPADRPAIRALWDDAGLGEVFQLP